MSNFYEEIIQHTDLKVNNFVKIIQEEEIEKLFIPEKLSETERINYIFKKGSHIQKRAVSKYNI